MHHNPPLTPRKALTRLSRPVRWAVRRRRTALTHLLRGACYGAGTGAVSILAVWAQQHL
ncbi:hypothetical protein OG949_41035 (plasmid) [Streptomyces scopuliridis]|uniref:hypothetical protein n=1 Tax=Streptomyces scopuliridis TaxID=452529 RepID=UPI002DDAFAAA|nr:hypothetical protein [Streptomyces scopuliridis]WSB39128.1 hypothetical protein OG949_41035 [Streptomyces scopuliridis]